MFGYKLNPAVSGLIRKVIYTAVVLAIGVMVYFSYGLRNVGVQLNDTANKVDEVKFKLEDYKKELDATPSATVIPTVGLNKLNRIVKPSVGVIGK